MKTAVIGANGFIGSRLVESFYLGDGPAVVPVVHSLDRAEKSARFALETRCADALDADSLAKALTGCAAAIHVVRGQPSDLRALATTFCRAATQAGVRRLVYLSNASIHGLNPPPAAHEKTHPVSTDLEPEGVAQASAEKQFFAECRRNGLTGFALRPGFVYGPRSPLFAELAQDLALERAWLLDRGEGVCNSLYIDNLVSAIRLCLKNRSVSSEAYLLGDAETVTWRQFYEAIAQELDASPRRIRFLDSPPSDAPLGRATPQRIRTKFSHSLAAQHLGYAPTVSLAEAVSRSCAWWRFAAGEFTTAA